MMLQLFKSTLPGSISFLLIFLFIGLVLLYRKRTHVLGRRCLWSLFILYVIFSLQITCQLLAIPLQWGVSPLQTSKEALDAEAVIVLDSSTNRFQLGENLLEYPRQVSALRALEAARVYKMLGNPLVIVSGGDDEAESHWSPEASELRNALIEVGVPAERVVLDSGSQNTREHAVNIAQILSERGITKFVLVTSSTHMRRAMSAFIKVGLNPVPSPSAEHIDTKLSWKAFWPAPSALLFTEQVMREYLGLVYYHLMGWA